MIKLINISKSYNNSKAVKNISFEVNQGEFLVLIGESGCGKTTTLKMINRLIEPTSGSITFGGDDILNIDPIMLRRKIGYVFQEIGLFPHMTISENISIVPDLLGWTKTEIKNKVTELFKLIGLNEKEFAYRKPSELSGGQKQRVGIARALAAGAKVLLMDEPFGALDPITRSEMIEELKKICYMLNLTVVMVTHDMIEGLLLADKIAVMKSGEIVGMGKPSELLKNPGHNYVEKLLSMPYLQNEKLSKIIRDNND